MRFLLAVLLLSLAVPGQAQTPPDDRYPSWANRLQGYTPAREWGGKVVVKHRKAKPRRKSKRAEPLTLAAGGIREFKRAVAAPFVHGRLACAINVNRALAARGIKGTGSALAMSYRHWGRASGPVPGAVAVFSRRGGGHVAIVHSIRSDGTVIYLNPSARRQAWVVGPYRRRPISYRVAS